MLIENQLKKLGFGTAAVFLLIVAMLLGDAQMYLMAVILALVPVAGWVLNRLLLYGLVCQRGAPTTADEHGRALVTVTIANRGRFAKFFIRALDTLPRYVRYAGSPEDEAAFLTRLWPGEIGKINYYIEPQKRGLHKIGPLVVQASDIFGFSDIQKSVDSYAEVLVYPEILPVTPSMLSSGAATGWRDEQNARTRGNGTDFKGVREYRAGDEVRRINWKTTARTGELAVTEYTQGYTSDLVIIIDREVSAYENTGSGNISAFEYGVKVAAAVGATALRQGSRVQLLTGGIEADRLIELRGDEELPLLLERLARIEPDGAVSVVRQMRISEPEIQSDTITVVITPRSPDDIELRAALDSWGRRPISSSMNVFWLDGSSFAEAHAERRKGTYINAAEIAVAAGVARRTEIGNEFTVSADTNLISLLGGPIG